MPGELGAVVLARAGEVNQDARLQLLAEQLVAASAGSLAAVLFFGSRRSGARTDSFSAYDLFVLVDSHAAFYAALANSGALTRPRALLTLLGRWLAPSQVSFRARHADEWLQAKCAVLSAAQFARETGARRHDHFCVARLFQATQILYVRDEQARERLLAGLEAAHRLTFEWSAPWLPESFEAGEYTRTLLDVSLRAEVRPEPAGRARQLWEAQSEYLLGVYPALLAELHAAGRLRRAGDGRYRLSRPVGWPRRLRVRAYFAWSLVRATARWAKHVLTFEGWLDYIARKAARHTGQEVELSARERRWPLIFLWPRVLRFLRTKNRMGK